MKKQNIKICVMILMIGICACSWADKNDSQPETQKTGFRILKQDLRLESIASVFDPNDTVTSQGKRLQMIIDKVLAMEPPEPKLKKTEKPTASRDVESEKIADTQGTEIITFKKKTQETKQTDPFETIIFEKSDQIVDPLAAAEALFKNKDLKNAAKYYLLGLNRIGADTQNTDRPWVIYQIGNCLRRQNPTEAFKYYEKLIVEYPDFYCSGNARVQKDIIAWYQQNNPSIILESYVSDPNSL